MTYSPFFGACLAIIAAAPAFAQDSSVQITGAIGTWNNQDGGSDIFSNGGINGEDSRFSADIGLSFAASAGNGLTAVTALDLGYISPADDTLDTDDATKSTAGVTLRLLNDQGGFTYGGFIGGGMHNDYGDSDEVMTYGYIGAEIAAKTSFGSYYGQIGYLDSYDEYVEGTREAPFINVGGAFDISDNYSLTGSLGYAGGKKYSSDLDNRIINLSVGVERAVGDYLVSVGYEATQISYEDADRNGDTFGSFVVGATYAFGGTANHGSPLPNLANWVSYNANEIE